MKNILVTGATGLIGYNLVKRLLQDEEAMVFAAGRSMSKLESTFDEFKGSSNLQLCVYRDVIENIDSYSAFDYIYHAAGPMERDIILNRSVDVVTPNIIDLHSIMEYAVRQKQQNHSCRVVIFSSVTVYQNNTTEDIVVSESDTQVAQTLDNPMVCYSESKRMSEVIARAYAKQYGIDVVIARFSTVYGPTKNIPDTAFYNFIRNALAGEDITINGVGLPRRDNIYVDDAVEGVILVAEKGVCGEAYNVSSNETLGNYMAVDEIAKLICVTANRHNGSNSQVYVPASETRTPGLIMNNSKLSQLGWQMKYSINDGIILTMRDYRIEK